MMRTTFKCVTLMTVVLLLVGPASAQSYEVYKTVPDVDKPKVANPPGPIPDNTCWQAAAANVLAGAGWGLGINTAQQNADAIYGHMNTHFGIANTGDKAMAVNWWLYNYGYNPDEAPNGWYQPSMTYNDVTVAYPATGPGLSLTEYDFLLDELARCQYVIVSWEMSGGSMHAMTLVGGDYSHGNPNTSSSVWHDSDVDVGGTDDDVYVNGLGAFGWNLTNYTSHALSYLALCPGLQKPEAAMNNYDAAYYGDRPDGGSFEKVWRVAGENATWGEPTWDPDGQGDYTLLRVPNVEDPLLQKEVHLLVDFYSRSLTATNAPDITIRADDPANPGNWKFYDPTITVSGDGGQLLYTWVLDDQPAFEDIMFPDTDFYYLTGDVKDFNIATDCVPEPMTVGLLMLGGVALIRRRRR